MHFPFKDYCVRRWGPRNAALAVEVTGDSMRGLTATWAVGLASIASESGTLRGEARSK